MCRDFDYSVARRRRFWRIDSVLAALLSVGSASVAIPASQAFTADIGTAGSHQPLNGWDASFAFVPWHGLRFKVDTTGYRGTNLNAPQHLFFIMGGGEYSHRLGRESVFVEGLGGTGGANRYWGANQTPAQTASFAAFMGGGVDTPISKRFAWRVEGGYQYSYFQLIQSLATLTPVYNTNLPTNFGRFSTGLVWSF